jgi:hypothetical protein
MIERRNEKIVPQYDTSKRSNLASLAQGEIRTSKSRQLFTPYIDKNAEIANKKAANRQIRHMPIGLFVIALFLVLFRVSVGDILTFDI